LRRESALLFLILLLIIGGGLKVAGMQIPIFDTRWAALWPSL
jgi:hypothetical protein